jgi:hypothetical protein
MLNQRGSAEMASFWEEIHGFSSPGEYNGFCTYRQVASGAAIVRTADPSYEKGKVYGGRWFEDPKTKEIWRLVPPDFPFKGLWERINVNRTDL